METVVPASSEAPPQAPPAAGPSAEGDKPQETQPTDQKPANEVAQEGKDSEEKHRSRAYRRLDRWRQRAIEAETRLKAFQEVQHGSAQSKQAPQEPASDEPKRDQFGSYEEFIEARAAWRAEKAADEKVRKILDENRKTTEQERTRGEHEKLTRAWNAQIEKARDELEDFDEVCAESEAIVTPKMSEAILESDKGAMIAYYLAKNPGEAERISKLAPSKQVAAIVALEDKVAKPAKQPSKAPEPIAPVGQKAEVEKDPSKMSDAEFAAWRRKQIARRR